MRESEREIESYSPSQAVSIAHKDNGWGGLHASVSGNTLIDGSSQAGVWFYAVGAYTLWGGNGVEGFPGWNGPVKQVRMKGLM